MKPGEVEPRADGEFLGDRCMGCGAAGTFDDPYLTGLCPPCRQQWENSPPNSVQETRAALWQAIHAVYGMLPQLWPAGSFRLYLVSEQLRGVAERLKWQAGSVRRAADALGMRERSLEIWWNKKGEATKNGPPSTQAVDTQNQRKVVE